MTFTLECPSCAQSLEAETAWANQQVDCPTCGQAFTIPAPSPAPVARIAPPPLPAASTIELWNPNAAVNWSLLFGPAFGSLLHFLNWKAIGDNAKAQANIVWLVLSLAATGAWLVGRLYSPDSLLATAGGLAQVAVLILWYFTSAKNQAAYVKERFGKTYPRRSWAAPLAAGFVAIVGVFFLVQGSNNLMISSKAVELANEVLTESRIDPGIRCVNVRVEASLENGGYQGTAFFSNGAALPIFMHLEGNFLRIQLDPAQLLEMHMGSVISKGIMEQTTQEMNRAMQSK